MAPRTDGLLESLQQIRRRLLDTSNRNRLLNFRESKARTIRIVDELPDEVFSSIVDDGTSMDLVPVVEPETIDPDTESIDTSHELPVADAEVAERHTDNHLQTPYTPQKLERLCSRLTREAKTAIEETGCNMLFLALGFLEWFEDDSSDVSHLAPLILVPAQIEKTRLNRDTNCYSYVISYSEEDLETNLSLAEKLRQDFDLILPELNGNNTPEAYFTEIADKILVHKRRWKVRREMVLDLFSFAKIQMYKDLDDAVWPHGAKLTANRNLGEILAGMEEQEGVEAFHQQEYDIDREPLAQNLHLVLDADSSQHSAIIDTLHRDSNLVIEGPPGTGKSQTITNIIAAALGMGKSVLFVAEKKAALEVVRTRLEKSGLGDFCLELHSHKTQKGKLHADLLTRLHKTFDDGQALERELADLKAERDKLLQYSSIVNSQAGPNGERVYQIFWSVERWRSELPQETPHIPVDDPFSINRQQANERAILLQDIARLRSELPDETVSAWQGFHPTNFLPGDQEQVQSLLDGIARETAAGLKELEALRKQGAFPAEPSLSVLRHLAQADLELFDQMPTPLDSTIAIRLIDPKAGELVQQFHQTVQDYHALLAQAADTLGSETVPEESLPTLAEQAAFLEYAGYGDTIAADLVGIADPLAALPEMIRNAEAVTANVPLLADKPIASLSDASRLLNIMVVIGKAPLDATLSSHPPHAHESALSILQKAQEECVSLIREKEALESIFSFNLMPPSAAVIALAREARRLPHPLISFFMPASWRLKAQVREFLKPGMQISMGELANRLEQAATILQRIEQVAAKQDYCQLLGPLYTGTATDWDRLGKLVGWAQEFSRVLGSANRAMALLPKVAELADIAERNAASLQDALQKVKSVSHQARFSFDPDVEISALVGRITETEDAVSALAAFVAGNQRRSKRTVASLRLGVSSLRSAGSLGKGIDENREMVELLEHRFAGTATDTAYFVAVVDWLTRMQERGNCSVDLLKWLVDEESGSRLTAMVTFIRTAQGLLAAFDNFRTALGHYGELDFPTFFCSNEHDCTLTGILRSISSVSHHIHYLTSWADYSRFLNDADSQGLSEFVAVIEGRSYSAIQAFALYHFAHCESMSREVMKTHPPLASFSRSSIEGIIQRFVSLDRQILKTTTRRIANRLSKCQVPPGHSGSKVSSLTELTLIKHEIAKQRKHVPIRQLVRRAGKALQALKPCFMMSPLSVAQFIAPASLHFDLIVMDEASQLKPEDSLGAVVRGARLVVVGDPRQLPPTSFFDRVDGTADEDANLAEEAESILDRCLQIYPRRRLRWHYRSEHESLIAFSNASFYDDNPLLLFPSPHRSNRRYGVHYHYVEGAQYQKGLNLVEAQTVVNAIREHFRQCPGQSLGVATFNREQSDLIQELLEKLQKENPQFDQQLRASLESDEPFFVKNLENVQGDERDVIFISTTYGPDPATGRVFQRFGPLSGDTGWRRLNVIITRAKQRVEVFSSMHPSDITPTEGTKKGVHALKAYLEYAMSGTLPDYGTATGKEPDSDFEVAVMKVLRDLGYGAVPQVGVAGFAIDIGVKHPERESDFILGVECDGATYHSAKSVRDRDRLRQEILESKGWRIHRIWSTDWFKNREVEIKRLRDAIDAAIRHYSAREKEKDIIWETPKAQPRPEQQQPHEAVQLTVAEPQAQAASSLREELKVFYESQILPSFPDRSKGLLRDEMLVHLVNKKPTSLEEFYKAVPMELRQKTDSRQLQYLDEIFSVISCY